MFTSRSVVLSKFSAILRIRPVVNLGAYKAMEDAAKRSVEYNWLSDNCGLKVSNICLGTMTFGTSSKYFGYPGNTGKDASMEILDRYTELGGNFLDTANIYGNGESEEIIGSWLSSRDRDKVFLATKVFGRMEGTDESFPNQSGLSRGAIMTNIEQSLKRLKTDYVDLYYMHCWDQGTKIEETLRAFDDLVRSGKVRYVGLSNFTGSMLQKMIDYSHFMGFTPCVVLQGLLTGKFKRDDHKTSETLAGTRLGWVSEKPSERAVSATPYIEHLRDDDDLWKLIDAIEEIGKSHGKTAAQVSLRWLLQKDFIPSVIIGAKSIKQLEENMGAGTGWKLTDEQMSRLDDLSRFAGSIPKYPYQTIDLRNERGGRIRPK